MTKFSAILAVAAFVLVVACSVPEPVVQQVEVTRLVDRTMEVQVTVPVTRVIERTIEVEVTVPVTRILENTVEVTREVTREVPVTVVVTPTLLAATATPRPTSTPGPTPTPSIALSEATRANLWVHFSNDGDRLAVYADPAFDLDQFDLDLLVDGVEYCNAARIYGDDGPLEMGCETQYRSHTTVQRVSAQTPIGDLRCERNNAADSTETVFACAWRR